MDGVQVFTIIHPFHPLRGQPLPLIARCNNWGEPRVQYQDPLTGFLRSIPLIWTDLAPLDPFVELAAGRAILRLSDLQELARLLNTLATSQQDGL
jgi:hypothetical protein